MAKETCACCGGKWHVQLETEKGGVKLCAPDAEYAIEVRQKARKSPKFREAWERFLNRVFK